MARVRAQGHSDSYKKLGSYVGKIWNPSDGKEQPKPSLQSCAHTYHEMNNKNHSNYSYFKKMPNKYKRESYKYAKLSHI